METDKGQVRRPIEIRSILYYRRYVQTAIKRFTIPMSTSRIFKSRNGYFKTWLVIDVQTTDMGRSVKGLEGGRQASMNFNARSRMSL